MATAASSARVQRRERSDSQRSLELEIQAAADEYPNGLREPTPEMLQKELQTAFSISRGQGDGEVDAELVKKDVGRNQLVSEHSVVAQQLKGKPSRDAFEIAASAGAEGVV